MASGLDSSLATWYMSAGNLWRPILEILLKVRTENIEAIEDDAIASCLLQEFQREGMQREWQRLRATGERVGRQGGRKSPNGGERNSTSNESFGWFCSDLASEFLDGR